MRSRGMLAFVGALSLPSPFGAGAATVALIDPGQPGPGQVSAGGPAVVVGRFALATTGGSATVTRLAVEDASASPARVARDVRWLLLFEDANADGRLDPGTDALRGRAAWDPATGRYAFRPDLVVASPIGLLVGLVADRGAAPGATFRMRIAASDVSVKAPGAVAPGGAVEGSAFAFAGSAPEGGPGSAAPMVQIVNPGDGASVRAPFRVQVQVYAPGGLASLTGEVDLSTDGGATWPVALVRNHAYDPVTPGGGSRAAVFETPSPLAPPPAAYALRARVASAGAGVVWSAPSVVLVGAEAGDGHLLVRDNSSQLCSDCHALPGHSSQSSADPVTGLSRYGSWSTACRDCHAPHGTTNVHLLRTAITPPAVNGFQPSRDVRFHDAATGDSGPAEAVSFVTGDAGKLTAGILGPCQACHTRTTRWTSAGATSDLHRGNCSFCHRHDRGFLARCQFCHPAPPATGSHAAHYADASDPGLSFYGDPRILRDFRPEGGPAYLFGCGNCHPLDPARHGDGSAEVELSDPSAPAGSLKAASTASGASFGGGSCSAVYCHSRAQTASGGPLSGAPGEYALPAWGGPPPGCGGCHGEPPESGSHARHAGEYRLTCAACHAGSAPGSRLDHVNGSVDVAFESRWGGGYLGTPSPGDGFAACAATYCHGDGTSVTTGVIPATTSPAWGGPPPGCDGCHGYPPLYDHDAPKSNSHWFHQQYGCQTCHDPTTHDGQTIADPSRHANGAYDVAGAPGLSYEWDRGGGYCSGFSCHLSKAWGGEFAFLAPGVATRWDLCYAADFSVRAYGGTGRAPYTFEWSFGDGTTASQGPVGENVQTPAITHHYPGPGPFEVVVTVRDADFHRSSSSFSATVAPHNDPPAAGRTVSVYGMTVALTDLSTDPDFDQCGHSGEGTVAITWGDATPVEMRPVPLGREPSGALFTHTYAYAGSYTIRHYATDNSGYQVASANARVTVPTANTSVSGRVTHAGGSGYLPGSPASGVSMSLRYEESGAVHRSAVTDANGEYLITGATDGRCYLLRPAKAGFTFTPAEVSGICASAVDVDFVASP